MVDTQPKSLRLQIEVACPNCRRGDKLDVEVLAWVRLSSPKGLDVGRASVTNDQIRNWPSESDVRCECGWTGHAFEILEDAVATKYVPPKGRTYV